MLSGWELGRHVTSIGHRAMLCEIFGQPPDVLFAHQDEHLASGLAGPKLLAGWDALQAAMLATVTGARECLVVTGSRSRDRKYLEAIEAVVVERPSLVCYRVLFGPPHHQVLNEHLLELLRLRDPGDRSLGVKTLHVGMVEDVTASPERFFCASERMAVTVPLCWSSPGTLCRFPAAAGSTRMTRCWIAWPAGWTRTAWSAAAWSVPVARPSRWHARRPVPCPAPGTC